jgi:hypothetical protein
MRYLEKNSTSPLRSSEQTYRASGSNVELRSALLAEQSGFCAYSEKFVDPIEACVVEHFDPNLKGTDGDGYANWYAVVTWMNERKPKKIGPYLPILSPADPTVRSRFQYRAGVFDCLDPNDREAENLAKFLLWNRPELVEAREAHAQRIRDFRDLRSDLSSEEFVEFLCKDPSNLSYATALESALGVPIRGVDAPAAQ